MDLYFQGKFKKIDQNEYDTGPYFTADV